MNRCDRSSSSLSEHIPTGEHVCFHRTKAYFNLLFAEYGLSRSIRSDDGVYDLLYRFYHIGRYDRRENRVKGVISRVPTVRPQVEVRPKMLPMSANGSTELIAPAFQCVR